MIVDLKGRSRRSSQARRPKIAFQRFFGIFPGHLTLPGVSSSWRVATDITPQKSQQRTTAWNQVPKNFSCEQVVVINQRSSHFWSKTSWDDFWIILLSQPQTTIGGLVQTKVFFVMEPIELSCYLMQGFQRIFFNPRS